MNTETGTCQCPDHSGQKVRCKHLIANIRASFSRAELMTLEMASGSDEDNVPVQLNIVGFPPPPSQEWVYNQGA